MPDQEDLSPFAELALGLDMNLGDERAGGIENEQIAGPRGRRHGLRHAMGGEHDGRAGIRDFVQFLDEDGALGLEALYHVAVMDDGMAHINGRAVFGEGELDDLDGAVDAGAEATRSGEIDGERGTVGLPPVGLDRASHLRLGESANLAASRSSLALSRLLTTDSLARKGSKKPATRDISKLILERARHIRRGCLACQAEDGVR